MSKNQNKLTKDEFFLKNIMLSSEKKKYCTTIKLNDSQDNNNHPNIKVVDIDSNIIKLKE